MALVDERNQEDGSDVIRGQPGGIGKGSRGRHRCPRCGERGEQEEKSDEEESDDDERATKRDKSFHDSLDSAPAHG